MTFSRAKPTGWTDNVDTITAAQINQIDLNQSRAIDGNAGGTYIPSGALTLGGSAGVTISASNTLTVAGALDVSGTETVTGQVVLSGNNAGIGLRLLTLNDADQTVQGATRDVLIIPVTLTANRAYTILGTSPVPKTGHVLRIVRASVNMANTAPSNHTCTLNFGGTALVFRGEKWAYLHLMWTGSQWLPITWSPTTLQVLAAIEDSWA